MTDLQGLRVVDHPLEIHDDCRLVSYHPGVMARGEERNVARTAFELGSVVHYNQEIDGETRETAAPDLRDARDGKR